MASFPNIVLTQAGLNMIAQAHDGTSLIFTKMQLGNGNLVDGQDIKTLTTLIQAKLDVPLNNIQFPASGQVKLRFSLSSVTVTEGFFVREVGVFAKLGEDGLEQLYAYTNAGNQTDFLAASDLPINELFDIDVVVGNATVLNVIVKDEITATLQDLKDHNNDPNAHEDLINKIKVYEICEFYDFRHPTLKSGFVVRDGSTIANADSLYPKAYEYLQTTEGQLLCKTTQEWENMSTLAGGTGGVPYFVVDTSSKTIRVPDTRGDFARHASNNQDVGQWLKGTLVTGDFDGVSSYSTGGLFTVNPNTDVNIVGADLITNPSTYTGAGVNFITGGSAQYPSSTSPFFAISRPRNYGVLGCVYLGGAE